MRRLILSACAAVALVVVAPAHAFAHQPGAHSAAAVMADGAATPAPNGLRAVAPVFGMRFEQRARGGSTVGRAVPRSGFGRRFFVRPVFVNPFAFGVFGLGFAYDPFFWGWGGYPYGWGYPYWGPPGYGYGYGYGYRGQRGYERHGSLKLDVQPKSAEVYVDGYYLGQVRDFTGPFHHLDLAGGEHKIEIRANGYQALNLDMKIMPGRTVTYRGEMRRGK